MFAQTDIAWPAVIESLFQIMSAFNFNLDLIAPECAIPSVNVVDKWLAIELLPLLAMAVFMILHAVKTLHKLLCTTKTKGPKLTSHVPVMISTLIVIIRTLYLYLTRTTLDVFNCIPTVPSDGNTYMEGQIGIVCWQPGSDQMMLLPFGIVALLLYTVSLPLAALLFMRHKREVIKYDQILRAKGLGDDRTTNKYYRFRK
jgi:hypothetical protein